MFKPSTLPIGTTIDDSIRGKWIKESNNAWSSIDIHCVDCAEVVFDGGTPTAAEIKVADYAYSFYKTPSDEFFTDFKIVSLPILVVEHIINNYTTETDVLKEALAFAKEMDEI